MLSPLGVHHLAGPYLYTKDWLPLPNSTVDKGLYPPLFSHACRYPRRHDSEAVVRSCDISLDANVTDGAIVRFDPRCHANRPDNASRWSALVKHSNPPRSQSRISDGILQEAYWTPVNLHENMSLAPAKRLGTGPREDVVEILVGPNESHARRPLESDEKGGCCRTCGAKGSANQCSRLISTEGCKPQR